VLDCILLAIERMAASATQGIQRDHGNTRREHHCTWGLAAAFAVLAVFWIGAAPARADDPWKPPPRVRPGTDDTRRLVADGMARSAAIRGMVDRLERSDLVVYIRHRVFVESAIDGWIGMLSASAGRRYVVIELACGRTWVDQLVTLGHELHHAVEIANQPSVVNARSLAAFYQRIGVRTSGLGTAERFETAGARETAMQVRREVWRKAVRLTEDK